VFSDSQQRQTRPTRWHFSSHLRKSLASLQTSQLHNLFCYTRRCTCPIMTAARTNDCPLVYVYIRNVYKTPSFISSYLPLTGLRREILPVVLYGCETWSLTLREEYRLRLLENKLLRRIFGPKRNEVKGRGEKNT